MTNREEANPLRFLAGLAILLIALFLQIFLAAAGWHFNLTLATLIAFAFVFDFLELLIFDLAAIFILNWQPAPSAALVIFALIPLAAFVFRKFVHSERWIGGLFAIFFGFLIFSISVAPNLFFPNLIPFFMDVVVALVVGEAILVLLTP